MLRAFLAFALATAMAIPAASAWSVDRQAPLGGAQSSSVAAWTTDLQPRAFPAGDVVGAVHSAAACALGDVTGDGVADLVVLASATASSGGAGATTSLQALAGPDFTRTVWQKASDLPRSLRCAPDLDLDGTLDPILATLGPATATASGAAGQARQVVQQTLQGASGAALVGRLDPAQVTGAATGGLQAGQAAASALLPAAEGAAAYLQASASGAAAQLPAQVANSLPLPVGSLTATAQQAAQLQVLDAAGAVVSTVSIDEAGVDPLALAPVQLTGALPDVAVLTQSAVSPVKEATANVPRLALYAADGTLAWSTQLAASAGVPILVPNAGDLDLDGVGDLIVTTVEQPLQAAPGAAYSVLSGVDGRVLYDSGPAVTGLVAALPLGQLQGGASLLEATQVAGTAQLTLRALAGGDGHPLWSVDVDALAKPANLALDPHTGDVLGFTDLTGDAVPDVGVAVQQGSSLVLQTIDGATGSIVSTITVPNASEAIAVVIGAAQAAGSAAGGAGLGASASAGVATPPGLQGALDPVQEAAAGATASLLAIGHTATNATLALVDAARGTITWASSADLPASFDLGSLVVQAAGDLDGDRVQDLLVTAMANGSVPGLSGNGARGPWAQGTSDAAGDGEAPVATVAAVSGASGDTVWTNSTAPGAPQGLDFNGDVSPASAGESQPGRNGVPAPGLPWLVAAVGLAAFAMRRRR